ncbi:MAG: D-amino-acid transaminase [Thermaerobacter sp.]|nr:D-amino-acid transaminase [Thermaerobacter sp.]
MDALQVYLNGEYPELTEACVSVEDRGFLFADGIYEVVRCYAGRFFELDRHLARLERSAREIRLGLPLSRDELRRVAEELLRRTGLLDCSLYLQATRGVAPRNHAFPVGVTPTLFAMLQPAPSPDPALAERGGAAVTVPDERWGRCDIKAVGLLPNILAKQKAVEAGAQEAIFIRDGLVTEGSASNVFAVLDGVLWTHPQDRRILGGITREVTLELAREQGVPVREEAITQNMLWQSQELFCTGTVAEFLPVVRLDGQPVGDGRPGPVCRRLAAAFAARHG